MGVEKTVIALIVGTQLYGCAQPPAYYQGYEGPKRADTEHARVYPIYDPDAGKQMPGRVWFQETRISCIDGVRPSTAIYDLPPVVLLEPGRHYLTVVLWASAMKGGSTMWLDAEAGHEYDAKLEQKGQYFRMWFEDRATKAPVGGLPGGEPPGNTTENKCK